MHLETFLAQAFVYLFAAVISVPLAKRLGFGSVLGYLIAGMALGPAVLGLVGGEGKDVMHVAEFGVVMMLFIVGLELRPSLLWRLRRPIFGLGGLQVGVTGIAIGGGLIALGHSWQHSLAVGMIFAMSSTAIVIQSLSEKGWLKSEAGQACFSVLLFQDLAVIPLLALLPLLATGAGAGAAAHDGPISHLPGWLQAVATLGAVAAVVIGGRFMLRPIFRYIAASKLREIFTASALALVVGVAVLMQSVGLSPALGAFLGGVVLADSEYRHELESNLEPFKGLLLGIFFIAVGASVDFKLIGAQPATIAGLTLGLFVVKGLVLFILGYIFNLDLRDRTLFAIALAEGGEFCFVLLGFTVDRHVLPESLAGQLTAVVALSMAISPLLLMFYEKVLSRRLAKQHKKHKQDTIDEHDNPVIIAGYGRVGHIIGRVLLANSIHATVIDLDHDQIEFFRKLGLKVFYGDASRLDLLHAAGASSAKLFILAIDDEAKSVEIVETLQRHFPNLPILVRAAGRLHAFEFHKRGIETVFRETLDSSLEMTVAALRHLGLGAYEARRAIRIFREHDEDAVREMAKIDPEDDKSYIAAARQRIDALNALFRQDPDIDRKDMGWDSDALRPASGEK
ncbi:MAG: glutathione-regulated potassium efflux system protein KefC-like protein [Verrucomicrobiaceae bacterium]|nr:glutathione-regulated potassium efflux system protein KefC-like protein [Verrucomicrobiaceae bacterium]